MPETVGRGYLDVFLKNMPNIINSSVGILTVSNHSKNDILKFFPSYPAERICVTPLAANSTFYPQDKTICKNTIKKLYNIDSPYILYVGGFSKRKNVKNLILAYEKIEYKNIKFQAIKSWSVLVISVVLIFNYIIIANVSYHKLNMAYEKSIGTLNRIADRIEQTDCANACDSILVLGALDYSEAYSSNIPPDMTGTTDGHIIRADDEIVGQSVLCSALNDYCGKEYKFLSSEEKQKLLTKIDEYSLRNWPDKNSIQIIDNVIVIKLGD